MFTLSDTIKCNRINQRLCKSPDDSWHETEQTGPASFLGFTITRFLSHLLENYVSNAAATTLAALAAAMKDNKGRFFFLIPISSSKAEATFFCHFLPFTPHLSSANHRFPYPLGNEK